MKTADTNQLKAATSGADESISPEIVSEILAALRGPRYGSVVVTVHASKVVQIEKNEKLRLQKKAGVQVR